MLRNREDFPAPLGPIRAMISRQLSWKVISRRMLSPSRVTPRSRTWSRQVPGLPGMGMRLWFCLENLMRTPPEGC